MRFPVTPRAIFLEERKNDTSIGAIFSETQPNELCSFLTQPPPLEKHFHFCTTFATRLGCSQQKEDSCSCHLVIREREHFSNFHLHNAKSGEEETLDLHEKIRYFTAPTTNHSTFLLSPRQEIVELETSLASLTCSIICPPERINHPIHLMNIVLMNRLSVLAFTKVHRSTDIMHVGVGLNNGQDTATFDSPLTLPIRCR